ncbi:MAG: hypothetical protein D3903_09005 [Candidatus Electrothrix sp. GM3_4]|nr:hypothetical protein [Candidatus Electrothrix sp. GM3_4]
MRSSRADTSASLRLSLKHTAPGIGRDKELDSYTAMLQKLKLENKSGVFNAKNLLKNRDSDQEYLETIP